MSIEIDMDADRTRLRIDGVQLIVDGTPVELDHVELDTGSAFALLAPSCDLPSGIELAPTVQVRGFGGVAATQGAFRGVIQMPDGFTKPVTIVVLQSDDPRWFLGLPALEHYNLLLVPDERDRRWMTRGS